MLSSLVPRGYLVDLMDTNAFHHSDLWEDAFSKLCPKNKATLKLSESTSTPKDLLNTIKYASEEHKQKQWRVQIEADREPLVLRDVFSKIAT